MSEEDVIQNDPIIKIVMKAVEETCETMASAIFSQDPEFEEKDIIEYESRMRVFGLQKFNGPCFISVINFYADKSKFDSKDTCGTMVFYVEEVYARELLKALGQTGFDDEDEEFVMDNCGEIHNVISGKTKNDIKNEGYGELIISAPLKYRNDVPEGVEFNYNEEKLTEMSFFIKKKKVLVVDFVLLPIDKIKS